MIASGEVSESCEDARHTNCHLNGCCCKCHQRDTLTFAEAMALDPSEVEVRCAEDHCWSLLSERGSLTLVNARGLQFRRGRPKRSRVEEMADAMFKTKGSHEHYIAQKAATEAIRAVCEYLRGECRFIGSKEGLARDIERYFLEPRT